MAKVEIGTIGISAGLCWLGDPYYFINNPEHEELGKTSNEFTDKIDLQRGYTQFNYQGDYVGIGICFNTGQREGIYPVYAEVADGVIEKIWVKFTKVEEPPNYVLD